MGRTTTSLRLALAGGTALIATFCFERAASAEWTIGVEPRAEIVSRFGRQTYGGPALALSVGYSVEDYYPVMIIPELVLVSSFYAPEPFTGSFRPMLGVRAGIAGPVEVTGFVRMGYAGVYGRAIPEHSGTFEPGLIIEKRLERSLTIGGSVGYQVFFPKYVTHGAHVGFHLGFWL